MLGATTIWDTHTCLFSQKPANHSKPLRPFFMDKVAFLWILDHLQSTFLLKSLQFSSQPARLQT